jgi:ABC-type metal ion transport system, periplasmic component/surface adhesin
MRVWVLYLLLLTVSFAKLKVVATYPWIGELVREIGKDRVSLYVIAKGTDDPQFVVPKPSQIA